MRDANIKIQVPITGPQPSVPDPEGDRMHRLKCILDKWFAMTISIEDAYTEISELMGSSKVTGAEIESGHLKIRSTGVCFGAEVEFDGKKFDNFRKLTYIIEAGRHDRVIMEADCGYVPKRK